MTEVEAVIETILMALNELRSKYKADFQKIFERTASGRALDFIYGKVSGIGESIYEIEKVMNKIRCENEEEKQKTE